MIAVKLHLPRGSRQSELASERERERVRGEREGRKRRGEEEEKENEKEEEIEIEKRRERTSERPFGRGSAFSWRVHLRKMAPVGRSLGGRVAVAHVSHTGNELCLRSGHVVPLRPGEQHRIFSFFFFFFFIFLLVVIILIVIIVVAK